MRPIDADALHKDILDTITTCQELIANETKEDARERMEGNLSAFLEVSIRIKNAPTVDAVPVVRCKDCIHYSKGLFQGKGCCRRKNYTKDAFSGGKGTFNLDVYVSYNVEDDHYCSDGERRDEDETEL